MRNSNEAGKSSLDSSQSSESISPHTSRRGSLNVPPQAKESGRASAVSPSIRLTRKRAASLDVDSANHPNIEALALHSADISGPPTSDSTREHVCLCQPDPKIPRPRNAFILYRQHYQAQVVAQHPGVANPEISKIIGEQWREQAPQVKNDWKRLAEEEKQRHQRQYPGYRYRPRRAGKSGGPNSASSSTTGSLARCSKCGGRYISTPSIPLTPAPPSLTRQGQGNEGLLSLVSPSRPVDFETTRYLPHMQSSKMVSPRTAPLHQQIHHEPRYVNSQPTHTHHELEEELDMLSKSPELKRRRFNDSQRGYSLPSPRVYSTGHQYGRGSPISAPNNRQQQLPGPGMMVRSGPMVSPAQPSQMNQQPRHPYLTRSNTFDESLRLPPLQTQVARATTSDQRGEQANEAREIQARSVEAMVMTIPYINKIRVLTKICPPLPPPGPSSPAQQVRGAVIAVESADNTLLADVGPFIADCIAGDSFCALKTWTTSIQSVQRKPSAFEISAADTNMTKATSATMKETGPAFGNETIDPFIKYLAVIADMHHKSKEMVEFITTCPNLPTGAPQSSAPKRRILPIALIPSGFSLSISDKFALRIPINDSYAPVDHWQWMATLWRGIVGPDLTIFVTRAGREEVSKFGGVEIRVDCGAIVVRVDEDGVMDEKTARRLSFEVLEFVRGMEGGLGNK